MSAKKLIFILVILLAHRPKVITIPQNILKLSVSSQNLARAQPLTALIEARLGLSGGTSQHGGRRKKNIEILFMMSHLKQAISGVQGYPSYVLRVEMLWIIVVRSCIYSRLVYLQVFEMMSVWF